MKLNRQVHIYSFTTDCFYTDDEKAINDELNKLYIKRYQYKTNQDSEMTKKEYTAINKEIRGLKEKLKEQFKITRKNLNIRSLRTDVINENKKISIFESTLVRKLGIKNDEFSEDLMTIQVFFFDVAEDLIKQGFMYNGEKYVLFSASAGQIRTKKFVAIKESKLKKIENTLTCGLTWDRINECGGINPNKYLAYYALNSSATDVLEDFDIDKAIVVDDFEMVLNREVDFVDDINYTVERKVMDVNLPHMDGCGIWLRKKNSMIRSAWFKGLMGSFPFDKFILEMREKYNNKDIGKVKDIWGKEWDILADDIQYIFTASQMKINKPYYSSWQEYKDNFKKYDCEFCICNEEEDSIKDAKINYQFLQTLSDLTEDELTHIASSSISDIANVGNDFTTNMKLLGVNKNSQNWMQKALMIYPELIRDRYNHQLLKDCKQSLVKQAKAGRLNVNGKYTFVMPDLYAFCEWLFLGIKNPVGILEKENEVSCSLYENNHKLCCLRSPHLYREWGLAKNVRNNMTDKWFGESKAIYISVQSLLSKLLMFDSDGDILLVIDDEYIYNIAERNMKNIIPLYYNMAKAKPQELNYDNLYQGLQTAYTSANIGIISNNISKVWNNGEITDEQMRVIKLMCMENNFVIDFAKTLYKPTPNEEIKQLLKKYTSMKLPRFFKYAKDKSEKQIQDNNNGIINKLETIIPTSRIKFDERLDKPNINYLMTDQDFIFVDECYKVIELYDYWNKRQYLYKMTNSIKKNDTYFVESDLYLYRFIRSEILKLPYKKEFIVDSLVYFLYKYRKSSYKKLLWACFGEDIYTNIVNNTKDLEPLCSKCFKRHRIGDDCIEDKTQR